MPCSFHVIREVVRREVVLCHAADEAAARCLVGRGGGELIDSTDEGRVVNVEETPHSRRRRQAAKVFLITVDEEMSLGPGVQGDALLSDAGGATPAAAPVVPPGLHVGQIPHPDDDGYTPGGSWRDLLAGEVPQAGDEYRLNPRSGWEAVTRTLIGHAISAQARAQFRTRRTR